MGVASVEPQSLDVPSDATPAAVRALRQLGPVVLAGAILGLVVGGIGGRLAMLLLAVLNDDATGRISDDGFRMGQFTASGTFSLLFVGVLLGAFGGAIYNVVRPLLIGPRWFQIGCLAVGPGVVVGAALVHVDGIDFHILDPVWLGIALFVVIPALYGALLAVVAERWLRPGAWPTRTRTLLLCVPLLVLLPAAPVVAALVVGWSVLHGLRRLAYGRTLLAHRAAPWVGRAVLTVIFAVALRDLVRDVATLT